MLDEFQKLGDVAAAVATSMTSLRPKSRQEWLSGRDKTVGASELPALFGVHAHMTPFELFAIKSGQYAREFAEIEVREASIHLPPTERGNLLEPVAFELAQRLRPHWTVQPNQIPGGYVFVDTVSRLSCTPDAFLIDPDRSGRGALQVKSLERSIFRKTWMADGETVEPPISVAVQAIVDATLSGCSWACAAAIVVGFTVDFYLVDIPLHGRMMARARELVADFWRRIEANEPYAPDFARDGAVIAGLYGEDDGSHIDLSGNAGLAELLDRRAALKAREADARAAEKDRKAIDAELVFALGNAARGTLADGREISAKTTRRKGFTVEPTTFRSVRVKGEAA